MKHLPVLSASLLMASICMSSHSALAAIRMHVTVDTRIIPFKGSVNVPPDSLENLDVTLSDDYLALVSDKSTRIFDLRKRRLLLLDNKTRTYADYSLYSVVGFRNMEFQNRQMMTVPVNKIISDKPKQANSSPQGLTTIDNEHNLSVTSPGSSTVIGETVKGKDRVFSNGNRQLANWSRNGFAVDSTDAERFSRFIRYRLAGHPEILKKLAAEKFIPKKLLFTFVDINKTNCTMVINDLRHLDPEPYDISAYTKSKAGHSSDNIDEALDLAESLTPDTIEAIKTSERSAVEKHFRDGMIFNAFLGLNEMILMGDPAPVYSNERLTLVRSDKSVVKFISAMQAESEAELRNAITTFVDLRSKASTNSFLLKLYEATCRRRLLDFDKASKLFLEVLKANPALASAYKDLGDLLYIRYDTPRAWRCWDIGRRLAPQFKYFGPLSEYEKSLVEKFPEYF
jgi:tetratricopeptide (TPR) repeat protein